MSRDALDAEFAAVLQDLEGRQLLRTEPRPASGVDFCSNDYLGLRRHPVVLSAMASSLDRDGAGSGASRLLGGSAEAARLAEGVAANWLQDEDALLYSSGYQANLGLITALAGRGDTLVCDRACHASLIDAARLARATVHIFDHNDPEHAERILRLAPESGRKLVVTEGLFSMDGDVAPLAELAQVCERQDAWMVVDEAHSIGILGPQGSGAWAAAQAEQELPDRVAGRILACGKALGLAGAFVVGSRVLRALLLNISRPQIFSTAPPPSICAGLAASIQLCASQAGDEARTRLAARREQFAGLLDRPMSAGPIHPFLCGSAEGATQLAEELTSQGFDLRAVRPPTVPPGSARLRIVLRAEHTKTEIEQLGEALKRSAKSPASASLDPDCASPHARPFVIFGTDTDVGKTVAAAACVLAAQSTGPVRYWKPIQTGDEADTDEVQRLVPNIETQAPAFAFPLPASPHEAAAAAGQKVDLAQLDAGLSRACMTSGHLIVEPAGGLCVPLTDETLFVDWIANKNPDGVLVARSGLGTLNHSLLSLEALARRRIRPRALILVGPPHPSNRATLARHVSQVFELPILQTLDSPSLAAWVESSGLAALFQS